MNFFKNLFGGPKVDAEKSKKSVSKVIEADFKESNGRSLLESDKKALPLFKQEIRQRNESREKLVRDEETIQEELKRAYSRSKMKVVKDDKNFS